MSTTEAERNMLTAIESITLEATIDQVAHASAYIEHHLRLAKEMKRLCDDAMIAWVKVNGPLVVGDNVTKVIKQEKSEKPKDKSHQPVLSAAFDAAGGDMALVAGLIASDGIKPGALKRLVGQEKFDELYETTWKDVLRDGKPSERLVTQNKQFANT
jgi:hypothetical protein